MHSLCLAVAATLLWVASSGRAESAYADEPETVPQTYEGSGDAFKEGGQEIGEGFRGIGRGIRNTFTGRRSKEEYEQGKQIGEGVKDIGRGVAGGGRATGHKVKDAVTGEGEAE